VIIAAALTVAALAAVVAIPHEWWPAAPGRLAVRHATGLRPPPATHPKSVIIQARARQRRRRRRIAMSTLPVVGAAAGWAAGGGGLPPWHRQRSHSRRRGPGGGTPRQASRAENLPGLAALNRGNARVGGLSCPSVGDCALGGYYTDSSGHSQAFVASQADGKWARAEEVPGTAGLNAGGNAQVTVVSCPSAGNCLAGGFYTSGTGQQGFLIAENGGIWGRAQPVPGLPALNKGGNATVGVLSCSSVGNCAASGMYVSDVSGNQTLAFVISEVSGRWGKAQPVPRLAALAGGNGTTVITALSCASAGDCTAGGTAGATSGPSLPFAVSETGAVWGAAEAIPGTAATKKPVRVTSISCASPGNCGLVGDYGKTAFVASQADGTWAKAEPVPGMAALHQTGSADAADVSCPAAGECTAGGEYTDAARHQQAFIVTQAHGIWQAAREAPGTADLNAGGNGMINQVACAAVRTCAAGGAFTDSAGHSQALIVTQSHGTWQSAGEVPGTAVLHTRRGDAWLTNLSCPPAGSCGIAGLYYSHAGELIRVFVTGKR